jgi:hypothetical protein
MMSASRQAPPKAQTTVVAKAAPTRYPASDRGGGSMSFLKKLFGGGGEQAPAGPAATAEHAGFAIKATPYAEGGQWQMCGVIEKEVGGELRSHRFIRADRFPSQDQAAEFTLAKARQIIDQMGERVFG